MKLFDKVSNGLKRFANKRYILPLLALLIIILVFMQCGPFGSAMLKEMSGGTGTLDMHFAYSADQAYSYLDTIGSAGRLMYNRLLGLDFLFAVVYMTLQSLLITALIKKAKLAAHWEKLNLLPFVRSALDFAENIILLLLIANFPEKLTVAVMVASVITAVKLSINYGYIAFAFCLGALTTLQTVLLKSKKQQLNETR